MNNTVRVNDLVKKFGDFTAVGGVSFSVDSGEIFGFLGPNGAGKSTTIRMLCGILGPTSGKGEVGGYDIITGQGSIRQNIGYMSQKFSLYGDLTVEENIDFFSGIYSVPDKVKAARKEWVLNMAGLSELRKALTSNLSGGWKQRLALGCAIIHEPGIVFLDEPTSGVDPISRRRFWEIIKEMSGKGVTVFVTTHYMDEAQNCGRIALIYKGVIIALGTPDELKSKYMKEAVLEVRIDHAQEWVDKAKDLAGVKEAALFGVNLHLIAPEETSAKASFKELMRVNNVSDYSINRIDPSLEDVFVSLIESYDKQAIR